MSLLRAGVPVALLRVRGASGQSFRFGVCLDSSRGSGLQPLNDCPKLIQHLAFSTQHSAKCGSPSRTLSPKALNAEC
jgi:hypothetical protein